MGFINYFVIQIIILVSFINFANGRFKEGCVEKTLERREEDAEIVITATVKDLKNNTQHPGTFLGEVEIKRVFKGENFLKNFVRTPRYKIQERRYHRRVKVEGFGDPFICDSDIRRSETRILLLSTNSDGYLRLNSSVLRINMINLDYASAVVKGRLKVV